MSIDYFYLSMKITLFLKLFLLLIPFFSRAALTLPSLDIYEGDPSTYTLFRVDTSRLPDGTEADWKSRRKLFEAVGIYLTPKLLESKDELSFKTSRKPPKGEFIKKWLRRGGVKGKYHIVTLLVKREEAAASLLMERLTTGTDLGDIPFAYSASLIIFPQEGSHSMIYGLGHWPSLINMRIIVPGWGLNMVASKALCNPNKVRVMRAHNYSKGTPSTREDRSTELDKIESFEFQVGSEGLEMLRVLPRRDAKLPRVVKGEDFLQFTVDPSSTRKQETIRTLEAFAGVCFRYSDHAEYAIHPRLVPFLDEEIRDKGLALRLNTRLSTLIKEEDGRYLVFLDPSIFRAYSNRTLVFGGLSSRHRSIWPILTRKAQEAAFSLTTKIPLRTGVRSTKIFNEEVGNLVFSLPIEEDSEFYRYRRGRWFKVDASRFGKIRTLLRGTKTPASHLSLPLYVYDDTFKNPQFTKSYAEINYNRRVVEQLSSRGIAASLLDTLDVYLSSGEGDKFEFSDILIEKGGTFYIVHVKRADRGLSHHREQLERTADYLSTELSRPGSKDFLLAAAVRDLYRLYGIDDKKVKRQGKRLTHGKKYVYVLKKGSKKPDLKRTILDVKGTRPKSSGIAQKDYDLKELVNSSENIDFSFFEDRQEAFYIAMNALLDSSIEGSLDLSSDRALQQIEAFFDRVKNAIKSQGILFSNGLLTKNKRKKIVLVLAVIDDRQVQKYVKGKKSLKDRLDKAKKSTKEALQREYDEFDDKVDRDDNVKADKKAPLFHNQDLWGLDRTRAQVQKNGFGFKIMVINEHEDADWDAFGSLEEAVMLVDEDSDDEVDPSKSPKKGEGSKKSGSAAKKGVGDESDEEEDEEEVPLRGGDGRYIVPPDAHKEPTGVVNTFDVGTFFLDQLNTSGVGFDCAFFSTGYSRLQVANLLLDNEGDDIVRQHVGAQIHAAYLRKDEQQLPESILHDGGLGTDFQELHSWEKALSVVGGPLRERMHKENYDEVYEEIGDSEEERAFKYVYETHQQKALEFRNCFNTLNIFQRFIHEYIVWPGNAMEFQYTADGGVPTILDALAHIAGFQLFVYMENEGELVLRHETAPSPTGDIRRVHYSPAGIHFSKLKERPK